MSDGVANRAANILDDADGEPLSVIDAAPRDDGLPVAVTPIGVDVLYPVSQNISNVTRAGSLSDVAPVVVTVIEDGDEPTGAVQHSHVPLYPPVPTWPIWARLVQVNDPPDTPDRPVLIVPAGPFTAPMNTTSSELAVGVKLPVVALIATPPVVAMRPEYRLVLANVISS